MKYQIGDEIIVLHSHEEGKVVDIINEKMVMIEVRGVKFPAYMDQIDFPYFYRFTQKKVVEEKPKPIKTYIDNIPKEKAKPNTLQTNDGVWLVLIPKFNFDEFDDDYVELFKIYLVNKTNIAYKFNYMNEFPSYINFTLQSDVAAFHDFYLHDLAFEYVNDSPNFTIDFSLQKIDKLKNDNYETHLKLKPKQVYTAIEKMKANNEATIAYKLFDEYPDRKFEPNLSFDKLSSKGFKVYEASKYKDNVPTPRTVIDLHIEKITNDYKSKSNAEILAIQLKEFEKWYNIAVLNNIEKFTVVHGIGEGKLKQEIHFLLQQKKEVKSFVNQYTQAFGYGATEIFFNNE